MIVGPRDLNEIGKCTWMVNNSTAVVKGKNKEIKLASDSVNFSFHACLPARDDL